MEFVYKIEGSHKKAIVSLDYHFCETFINVTIWQIVLK